VSAQQSTPSPTLYLYRVVREPHKGRRRQSWPAQSRAIAETWAAALREANPDTVIHVQPIGDEP